MEPDEEAGRIARQLASVKPEYRPQIDKMLSAVLEISEIMQEGQ
jgi:hypothetical protein